MKQQQQQQKLKSYLVPNSAKPGYSPIMLDKDPKEVNEPEFLESLDTVYKIFQHTVSLSPNRPLLGARQFDVSTRTFGRYAWKTGAEVADLVDRLGSGLDQIYSKYADSSIATPSGQQALGIYSINRPEWLIAEFAGFRSRRFSVALYDTLGAESVQYVVNHAEVQVIVCSIDKVPKLLELKSKLPGVRAIISMDSFDDHDKNPAALPFTVSSINVLRKWAESLNVGLFDIKQVVEMGTHNPTEPNLPAPSDWSTICYTSGTTGNPKGAITTHDNYSFSAKSSYLMGSLRNVVYLSFLPLAHCFDRCMIYASLVSESSIGFFSGDTSKLLEDAQELKPTFMAGVPRLFNRMYDRIAAATIYAPGLTGVIARKAVSEKLSYLEQGQGNKHALWDRIIFNKVARIFGGRLSLIISGSAPLDAKVLSFLRISIGCNFIEGYGQTESCAASVVQRDGENTAGNIGSPLSGVQVRLRDVPEMNYYTTDKPCPRGEILLKGRAMFIGYYKDEEKTKEAFDDGWVVTGDIGQFNEDGNVKIIDRRKNIFKLAQGEYVAPEHLENVYGRHSLVEQVYVHGDSLKPDLVAVVVPDRETFVPWAQKITGNSSDGFESLTKDPKVVGSLLKELQGLGRKSKLQGYEIVKNLHCEHRPFDIESNGLLTSTFKLKRNAAKEYYAKQLEELYEQIQPPKK
ncbi:medium-chain fatty acid-CoA ligase faa2 [Dipsacomyces acuminosporus]|nr:medium-chain fatty acid-CoA ligase faa2 [Dipsacomyces acuminosporus]